MKRPMLWRVIAVAALCALVLGVFSVGFALRGTDTTGTSDAADTNNIAVGEPTSTNAATEDPNQGDAAGDCSMYTGDDLTFCEDFASPDFQDIYYSYSSRIQGLYCLFFPSNTVTAESVAQANQIASDAANDTALAAYKSAPLLVSQLQQNAAALAADQGRALTEDEVTSYQGTCTAASPAPAVPSE